MTLGVRNEAARPVQSTPSSLRRALGLWEVSLSGIGVILGAGVYALIGPAALEAGNALWATFFVAGITAGLTAYTYIRLAPLRPKNAPEYQYTSLAFGPTAGFVAGWLMLAASILAGATVALGFAGYLRHLVGTAISFNVALLFVVVTAVMLVGIAESVRIALILTAVEALGLVCVIVVGVPHRAKTNFLDAPLGLGGLFAGAALVFSPISDSSSSGTSPKRWSGPNETFLARLALRWREAWRSTS
jgi:APA family basic amino acid/polyamine antiporter